MRRETPWTVAESSALPPEMKDAMLREAKPGTWYDGWRPYCGQEQARCSMPRMTQEPYGFRCPECGNMIAWDLTRLAESPLNRRSEASTTGTRERQPPTCLITDIGHSHIAEAIRGAGFPVLTLGDCPITVSPPCDLFAGFSDRSYMKPEPKPFVLSCLGYDPDPVEHHRAPDETDEHSRMAYRNIGPTGHPRNHRRTRKMRKASKQRNRRK